MMLDNKTFVSFAADSLAGSFSSSNLLWINNFLESLRSHFNALKKIKIWHTIKFVFRCFEPKILKIKELKKKKPTYRDFKDSTL